MTVLPVPAQSIFGTLAYDSATVAIFIANYTLHSKSTPPLPPRVVSPVQNLFTYNEVINLPQKLTNTAVVMMKRADS